MVWRSAERPEPKAFGVLQTDAAGVCSAAGYYPPNKSEFAVIFRVQDVGSIVLIFCWQSVSTVACDHLRVEAPNPL